MFWTGQKTNHVTTRGQNLSDQGVVSCVSTPATVCTTALNHAPALRASYTWPLMASL